jgi:tetratricopeptide (TPR) repeat protein
LLSITLILVLSVSTYARADTWRSEESIIESSARHHPASPRSQFMMGEFYTYQKHDPFKALFHYSQAYELAPHETGYLIRIAMSTLSMHPQFASPTGADSLDTHHKIKTLPSPIVVNKSVNNRMRLILNSEFSRLIADRLKQRPLTENTRYTMHGLSRCLAEKAEICQNIYSHIIEWYKAMLANPHLTNKVRKESILSLFEIGITSKNYNLAMESVRYGQTTAPSDLDYLLMEANVYILLNRLDAAEELIHSVIESNKYFGNTISDNLDILTSEINARRKKSDKSNNP